MGNFIIKIVDNSTPYIIKVASNKGGSGSAVFSISIIGDGTSSYLSTSLIGKTILFVTTDSAVRVPTDYSLNITTGLLSFIGDIDTDTVIQIIYK